MIKDVKKDKAIGSVTRTGLAVGAGWMLAQVDWSAETLEQVLKSLEFVQAVIGIVIAQGWSLHEKKSKPQEKADHAKNLNT